MSAELSCALVITVKDDALALSRLLEALEAQTSFPQELCLVIAESEDETLDVAQSWRVQGGDIHIVPVPAETTRSQARNIGVAATRSSIIAFTDAGCLPVAHWLEALVAPFELGTTLVSGLTVPEVQSAWDEAQARFVLVSPERIGSAPHPATRNMAVTRELWDKSGGFLEKLNYAEDFEFARRLAGLGAISTFVPEAVVFWKPREDFASFFGMIFSLTRGDIQAQIYRAGMWSMWLRYSLFALFWILLAPQVGIFRSLFALATVIFFYLVFKQLRWKGLSPEARLWAFALQLVSDLAVLKGSFSGLAASGRTRENTRR